MFKPLETNPNHTPTILSNAPNPEDLSKSLNEEVLRLSEDARIAYCEEIRTRILSAAKSGTPPNVTDAELAKAIYIKTLALSPSPSQDIDKLSKPLPTKSAPSKPRAAKKEKEPKEPALTAADLTNLLDF